MARSAAQDPLEKFRFRVYFIADAIAGVAADGATPAVVAVPATATSFSGAAGFHDVSMPKRTTNKGTYREGDDNDISQVFAGLSSMEDITMSRGMYFGKDNITGLYAWAKIVHNNSTGNRNRAVGDANNGYKKDLVIEMLDREGNPARRWAVYNAFPVQFTPGSDLNASEDGDKSMESLTIAYEDFQEIKKAALDEVIVGT